MCPATRIITALILSTLFAPTARPCGPFFPNTIVYNGDAELLWAPVADFSKEISSLKPEKTTFRHVFSKSETDTFEATATADRAELDQALHDHAVPELQRSTILQAYEKFRGVLTSDWEAKARISAPPTTMPSVAIPVDLPAEFALYARGAAAYHQGDVKLARDSWQELLRLPEKQRHYRSVWAAFMLGRSERGQQTCPWYRQTRDYAAAGFADSLGLAASSYGWEAREYLTLCDYPRAVDLYLQQWGTGDTTAILSLQECGRELLQHSDANALNKYAQNSAVRQVITAFVVSHGGQFGSAAKAEEVAAWLIALEANAAKDVRGADRIAWMAYQANDMTTAQRWLDRAPADSPLNSWISAKLEMRAGNMDNAVKLLAKAAKAFPENEEWDDAPQSADGFSELADYGFKPADRVHGELGAVLLNRGNYVEALDSLLRGNYWDDSAYVAERVLTPDELLAYVSKNWPVPAKDLSDTSSKDVTRRDREGIPPEQIRYLLARRLTRIGRWKEARQFYPRNMQPTLDAYITAIRTGSDASLPAIQRGRALYQAAHIARLAGMELLGTERDPDNFIYGGSFGNDDDTDLHSLRGKTPPLKEELARFIDSARETQPHKRYHYRYIAADHAWAAAQLMPDESDETAKILCAAGSWLQARDPKAAQRFYQALVKRCATTALGQEAIKHKWFPKGHDDE